MYIIPSSIAPGNGISHVPQKIPLLHQPMSSIHRV